MSRRYSAKGPDRHALEQAGVDLPAVLAATVPLARRGTGKWHVVVPNVNRWGGGCMHARGLDTTDATQVSFLDTVDDICAKCSPVAALPDPVRGLWKACLAIVEADTRARALADGSGPRTWPGYARALAAGAHHDDDTVRALLKPWLDDSEVGTEAWTALRAWTAVVERSNLALASYQAAAPAADTTAAISRACDTVAEDPTVHRTSRALDVAVGKGHRFDWDHAELWPLVRTAWSAARRQGRSAAAAADFTMTMAATKWEKARVRDVTVLPDPPRLPAGHYSTPSAWADALLQVWWRETTITWCARLEDALAPGSIDSDERALLLVRDWPLTKDGDEELAYLAQFPQLGPAVPDDLNTDDYHRGPRHAVVLSVPRYAADQAVEHARYQRDRITLGGPDDGTTAAGPLLGALDLLRTVYPYLAEDTTLAGSIPQPSAACRAARAEERAARGSENQLHWADKRRDDSLWAWREAFRDGRWTWVPDDMDDGPAPQQLATLLERHASWTVMRLHVESGPAGATSVLTLFGHPDDWDTRRGLLLFRPVDGHRAVSVAQHRMIGLTGDRYRRGSGRPPLWEEYRSPHPYRDW